MIMANFCKEIIQTLAYLQWFLQYQCCAHNLSPDVNTDEFVFKKVEQSSDYGCILAQTCSLFSFFHFLADQFLSMKLKVFLVRRWYGHFPPLSVEENPIQPFTVLAVNREFFLHLISFLWESFYFNSGHLQLTMML